MVSCDLRKIGILLLILITINSAFCIGLGVSGNVVIKGILRGGYGVSEIVISNPNEFPITPAMDKTGATADWVSFEPGFKDMIIEPHTSKMIAVVIQPPPFTPNGVYTGQLFFTTNPAPGVNMASGLHVSAGAALNVYIEVSDAESPQMLMSNFEVSRQEECKPVSFTVTTSNPGNVELSPIYEITIKNMKDDKITVSKTFNLATLKPTLKRPDVISIDSDAITGYLCIPKGEYNIHLTGRYLDTQFYDGDARFSILEKGALSVSGVLINVTHGPDGKLGEPIKIVGTFKNDGELVERAKLKTEVYIGDRLVDVVEGNEVTVSPGKEASLSLYYIPKELGTHTLSTAVSFEGKSTDVMNTNLDVTLSMTIIIIVTAILIFIFGIAIVLIIKKLKK